MFMVPLQMPEILKNTIGGNAFELEASNNSNYVRPDSRTCFHSKTI